MRKKSFNKIPAVSCRLLTIIKFVTSRIKILYYDVLYMSTDFLVKASICTPQDVH